MLFKVNKQTEKLGLHTFLFTWVWIDLKSSATVLCIICLVTLAQKHSIVIVFKMLLWCPEIYIAIWLWRQSAHYMLNIPWAPKSKHLQMTFHLHLGKKLETVLFWSGLPKSATKHFSLAHFWKAVRNAIWKLEHAILGNLFSQSHKKNPNVS